MSTDDNVRREPIEGFDDVPGTTLFDAQRARQGYWVNQFCMSLMKAENRDAFRANEDQYLRKFAMSDEQREAILKRDWQKMIHLGGNIYYLSKLFSTDGKSFQYVAATMTGLTQDQYAKMMLEGGRTIENNRSKTEWAKTGGPAFGRPKSEGKA